MAHKPTSHAAHHAASLMTQAQPGQILLTPCPHCGKSFPRLEAIAHAQFCAHRLRPRATGFTIDAPAAAGTRGHDGMEGA